MNFKKRLLLVLLILGIFAISMSCVSAVDTGHQKVKLDGVDFVLNDDVDVFLEDDEMIGFRYGSDIKGYIAILPTQSAVDSFTFNDSSDQYITEILDSTSHGDEYVFVDGSNQEGGYFLIFKKNNKQFVYKVYGEASADEPTREEIAGLFIQFPKDNDGLKAI